MTYPIPGDSLFKDVLDCITKNNATANNSLRNIQSFQFIGSNKNFLGYWKQMRQNKPALSAELIGQLHLGKIYFGG